MVEVDEEFSAIQLLVITAQTELEKLDTPNTTLDDLHNYENSLRTLWEKLKALTSKVKADRSPKKQVWQRRIRSITDDYYSLKKNFSRISNNKITLMKKTELLSGANHDKQLDVESALLNENDSLARSTTMADYYLEMGKSSLNNLYDQHTILKRAQRRILDMANSLGLTGNLIHRAMSRSWWDRCLVYTGIIIISAGLVFVWYYKKH